MLLLARKELTLIMLGIFTIDTPQFYPNGLAGFLSCITSSKEYGSWPQQPAVSPSYKPIYTKYVHIHKRLWSLTVFTKLIYCSRKKRFRHFYTDVQAQLTHFTHSASIFWNRKAQRSFIRGCGTSIDVPQPWPLTFGSFYFKRLMQNA